MQTHTDPVNNEIYEQLGELWYTARDNPVALLRAESRARNPWIAAEIERACGASVRVLDIGCGAGFLSNELARRGFVVTGLDASPASLSVAGRHDATGGAVRYELGDAYHLPYADASFEAACAMDFLEHVEEPARVIAEAARVLVPGGLFFFATFNRNVISWLFGIKGVEWFVKNTPRDMHVARLFIKPAELRAMCAQHGLPVAELRGFNPKFKQRAFWRMLATGEVADDFAFHFTRSTLTGYIGKAIKESS